MGWKLNYASKRAQMIARLVPISICNFCCSWVVCLCFFFFFFFFGGGGYYYLHMFLSSTLSAILTKIQVKTHKKKPHWMRTIARPQFVENLLVTVSTKVTEKILITEEIIFRILYQISVLCEKSETCQIWVGTKMLARPSSVETVSECVNKSD